MITFDSRLKSPLLCDSLDSIPFSNLKGRSYLQTVFTGTLNHNLTLETENGGNDLHRTSPQQILPCVDGKSLGSGTVS